MKRIYTSSRLFPVIAPLLLAALFLPILPCPAEMTNQHENRFLFIVDTASAMRGNSNAVVQTIIELLDSDMKGEFRKNDTIGLWTYNDTLHTDFPMQVWSQADKSSIAANMAVFLQSQRYQKQAHLEKVMPVLNQIIGSSERITVILVFDGLGTIQGTPFDLDINGLQKKYARELRSAHVPFVTVLAAHNGAVFDYTINYPGLIAVPHTAYPEEPVETNAPVATIPTPAPAIPVEPQPVHSLIMSAHTNIVQATAPPPAIPIAPVVVVPVPAPSSVAPVVIVPTSQPVIVTIAPPPVVPVTPAPANQPAPTPIVTPQNPEPVSRAPVSQTPPVTVAASDQQPPTVPPVVRVAPVGNISPAGGNQLALFIMAFALLTIAVVLVIFLVRRSRSASQSSLITQSIDHRR